MNYLLFLAEFDIVKLRDHRLRGYFGERYDARENLCGASLSGLHLCKPAFYLRLGFSHASDRRWDDHAPSFI